jgi:N5-(cytidine 5'-diphosphoramidyl)-L-glutamine hydrolase
MNRIGLTMRIVRAEGYPETRDALAQDWAAFLAAALPAVAWLPIPNLGARVVDFARAWELDGFILTGGDDLGKTPSRDDTETALLRYALESGLPVFGVCRGLQFIQRFFGGPVQACAREQHVAVSHPVSFHAVDGLPASPGRIRTVNSFHSCAVTTADLARPLRAFATTADGLAEGIVHPDAPVLAVQWHPERTAPPDPLDVALLEHVFGPRGFADPPATIKPRSPTPLSPSRGGGDANGLADAAGISHRAPTRSGRADDARKREDASEWLGSLPAPLPPLDGERAGVRSENADGSRRRASSAKPGVSHPEKSCATEVRADFNPSAGFETGPLEDPCAH